MGVWTGTAIMENSVEALQDIKEQPCLGNLAMSYIPKVLNSEALLLCSLKHWLLQLRFENNLSIIHKWTSVLYIHVNIGKLLSPPKEKKVILFPKNGCIEENFLSKSFRSSWILVFKLFGIIDEEKKVYMQ